MRRGLFSLTERTETYTMQQNERPCNVSEFSRHLKRNRGRYSLVGAGALAATSLVIYNSVNAPHEPAGPNKAFENPWYKAHHGYSGNKG